MPPHGIGYLIAVFSRRVESGPSLARICALRELSKLGRIVLQRRRARAASGRIA